MMLKTTRGSTVFPIKSLGKSKDGEGGLVALVDQVMKWNPVQPSYKSQIKTVCHYVLQNLADQCKNAVMSTAVIMAAL